MRLNAEVVARAWQILSSVVVGVKNILYVVILFLMCLVRNLQKKMEKISKINPVVALLRYCTDRLTLRHVRLSDQFLEVKLKHLEAR